jgi:hypothetical protein
MRVGANWLTLNAQLVPAAVSIQKTPLPRKGKSRERSQIVAMQQTLFELVMSERVQPHIRAACARAWSELSERKRIIDGKPLPGSLNPGLIPRNVQRSIAFKAMEAIDVSAPKELKQ